MIGREEDSVRIDDRGVARPVGAGAQETMARFERATVHLLPSPPLAIVMCSTAAADEIGGRRLWLVGEICAPSKLLEVMTMVAQAKWRGELSVFDGEATRSVFFDGGNVVGAVSTALSERLGALLEHFGEMTAQQVEAASRQVGAGVRIGDAAVSLGFISPETLFRYLHRQTEEIVYATVAVGEGTFYFSEHFYESPLSFPLRMSVTELLLEGVRRMDETEIFRDRIPGSDFVPVRVDGSDVDASDEAYRVFLAVNGTRTVEQVAAVTGTTVFEVTRQLYELCGSDAITVRSPRASGLEGVVSIFNEAVALVLEEVDKHPGARQDIRDSLASFASAGEVYATIFGGAGPNRDGTFEAQRVLENLAAMPDLDDPAAALAEWLYEYASFGMFIAEPVLRAGAQSDSAAVASRVASLLAPIAPRAAILPFDR